MNEEPTIAIGTGLEIPPGSYLGNIKDDFSKLERSQEKANTFMMWMTGIIAGVFFVTGILIALDYFKYNEERYEKFIDESKDIRKEFYSKDEMEKIFLQKSEFYSKGNLDALFMQSTRQSQTLECLKIRQRFSIDCF